MQTLLFTEFRKLYSWPWGCIGPLRLHVFNGCIYLHLPKDSFEPNLDVLYLKEKGVFIQSNLVQRAFSIFNTQLYLKQIDGFCTGPVLFEA
jgi:hypothetical protein